MGDFLLELEHVHSCDSNINFQDICLSLRGGETHTVLGVDYGNLKGLLNLLSGVLVVESGSVWLNGARANLHKKQAAIQYILTSNTLCGEFTVLDNLLLMQSQLRVFFNRKKCVETLHGLMAEIGISLDLDTPVYRLSTEDRRTLLFLRAFLSDAQIVVIFDPNESMNLDYSDKTKKFLDALKKRGKGIIFLTAQLEKALMYADRVSLLQNGQLQGPLDGEAVRREPRHILALFSEWKEFQNEPGRSELQMADTLFQSIQFVMSKNELESSLTYLADSLVETLNADACVIHIIDRLAQQVLTIPDSGQKTVSHYPVLPHGKTAKMLHITRGMEQYGAYFTADHQAETMIINQIETQSGIVGVIHLCYYSHHQITAEDTAYMQAYSNEMAVIIEYSRLLRNTVLLKETHHRIKNNLQLVISLLNMQKSGAIQNPIDMIDTTISRVKSIATVHDMFAYDSMAAECGLISLTSAIEKLVQIYRTDQIGIEVTVEDFQISYDKATSILLILAMSRTHKTM